VYSPGCGANNAFSLILGSDGVELEVDKLANVADKWQDFTNAAVHERKRSEEIDDSIGYGFRILRSRDTERLNR
jgi:hypothetical protein